MGYIQWNHKLYRWWRRKGCSETTSYIAGEGGRDGRCETSNKPLRWDRSVCACYDRRKLYRPSMATCFRCGNWIATTLCPQTPRLVNGRHTQGSEPWWQKILLLGCKQNSCIYGLGKPEQIEIFQQSSPSAFSTFLALLHLSSFSPSSLLSFPFSTLFLLSPFPFPSSLPFPSSPLSLPLVHKTITSISKLMTVKYPQMKTLVGPGFICYWIQVAVPIRALC